MCQMSLIRNGLVTVNCELGGMYNEWLKKHEDTSEKLLLAWARYGQLRAITSTRTPSPHRWCHHLIVVVGFECSWDSQSYAGGSAATGRGTHAG
jgi:hypothetical protein